ncbi:hypothetical protein P0W64_13645 [Tsukamurella sp. 8F]|uniref:hypothetical protein n=1 Tax=unclassified Tsukamurella TaxID=2633480 RepID=UPI0023B9C71E|nr:MULTISPECIES: hypothetical protein [unclassified Tsukamurella]MDF0530615.1 hypothetical protein [Tsukamurella sp. 8J]MDF0587816.1 hypothetical protein [Tsukamurella sp. 8F]
MPDHPTPEPDETGRVPDCSTCGRHPSACRRLQAAARAGDRVLDALAADVAGSFTLLTSTVAVTESMVATLVHDGEYRAPSLRGGALQVTPGRVALRIAPERVVGAVLADNPDEHLEATMIALLDDRGAPVHRTWVRDGADRLIVESFDHRDAWGTSGAEAAGLLSTMPTPPEPAPWRDGDLPAQIDAILADDGKDRYHELVASDELHAIPVDLLPQVFEFLCGSATPVGVAVFHGGVAQVCAGPLHTALREGDQLLAGYADAALEIDLALVDGCGLVRSHGVHGPTTSIELYDAAGRCAALLTQFGLVDAGVHADWEAMCTSLRTAAR